MVDTVISHMAGAVSRYMTGTVRSHMTDAVRSHMAGTVRFSAVEQLRFRSFGTDVLGAKLSMWCKMAGSLQTFRVLRVCMVLLGF